MYMKKIYFVIFLLTSLVFCGNIFAEENDIDDSDPEFVYSDDEVLGLLHANRVGANPNIYNGIRVKVPGNNRIWVVQGGRRRLIPTPEVFISLFRDRQVHVTLFAHEIPMGKALGRGAHLLRGSGHAFYILDNNRKRYIPNLRIFNKYHFDGKKVRRYPDGVVNGMATGRPWR
jgi:hypothetical protein